MRVPKLSTHPALPCLDAALHFAATAEGVSAAGGSILVATPLVTLSGWWTPCHPGCGASCFWPCLYWAFLVLPYLNLITKGTEQEPRVILFPKSEFCGTVCRWIYFGDAPWTPDPWSGGGEGPGLSPGDPWRWPTTCPLVPRKDRKLWGSSTVV